ncbi:MAG: hypothetical protein JSR77_08795 [Planctomycetes bacterium]|nr:hypothetical protein [Planctomycetota bacterium]
MEFLRRTFAPIGKHLGNLTPTHKLLVGSVVVVLGMTLLLVSQYTGKPSMVELLPGAPASEQDSAAAALGELGIPYENVGGKVMVHAADKSRAVSRLGESGKLPSDKAILFENILNKPSWTNSRQQNEQLYNNALQNELSLRIADFKGIKSAKVFLDIPEAQGFGPTLKKPSASAMIVTDSGQQLGQGMVDAIANFIAGSKAGLTIDRVRVIDAVSGRQRKATTEDEALPTTYLEHAARVESQTREKVQELLAFIPGAVVAVTAQVDVTRSRAEVRTNMPEKQGTISMRKRETETTTTSAEAGQGGEAGFGANQTADINRGGGASGGKHESNETTTEYENHVGTRSETILDPRGYPTMVAVSVNVPKGFVANLLKAAGDKKDAEKQPTDEEVNQRFASLRKDIIDSLTPHVRAMTAQANSHVSADDLKKIVADSIGVTMIPVVAPAAMAVQTAGLLGGLGGGGGGGLLGGGLIEKGVLGGLSAVALGMMLMMVKKASRRDAMPTAEELVGLPPTLEADSDVVGEADEGDSAMAGIEVDEQDVQRQKVLEQVNELVSAQPAEAAKTIGRWITPE